MITATGALVQKPQSMDAEAFQTVEVIDFDFPVALVVEIDFPLE